MGEQHMSIAAQLGIFFPTVASAARAKRKEERDKKRNGKKGHEYAQASVVASPAPATDGTASYERLWGEGHALFSVKIPRNAKYKAGMNGRGDHLHFCLPVKGGVVNIHAYHQNNPSLFLGEEVICNTSVCMKRFKDGREYLYLNLLVLSNETGAGVFPTHEWRVVQGRDPIMPKGLKNVHHFPTPEPLDGAIVIGEIPPKFK